MLAPGRLGAAPLRQELRDERVLLTRLHGQRRQGERHRQRGVITGNVRCGQRGITNRFDAELLNLQSTMHELHLVKPTIRIPYASNVASGSSVSG